MAYALSRLGPGDDQDRPVELGPGELFVVPRGVEDRPRADQEADVLLVEPLGTPLAPDVGGERTPAKERI